MSMSWAWLVVGLSTGCNGKGSDDSAAGSETDADTDTDADSDSDTDADTDTDTDADTDTDTDTVPRTLTFALEGDWSGTTLTLNWLDWANDLSVGEAWLGTPVTSVAQDLLVPTPPAEHLQEVSPSTYPGFYLAFYLPSLIEDDDLDSLHDDGEILDGVGLVFPVFAAGYIPPELAVVGIALGWNALAFDLTTGVPEIGSLSAIPLATNLVPRENLTLSGTYTGDPTDVGLAVIPEGKLGPATTLLHDEPVTAKWSIALEGQPPAEHIAEASELSPIAVGLEAPVTYDDLDQSGTLTTGDTLIEPACMDGLAATAIWIEPVTDPSAGLYLSYAAVGTGWSGAVVDDKGGLVPLADAELTGLTFDGTCSF